LGLGLLIVPECESTEPVNLNFRLKEARESSQGGKS
jgi:hypothetical protein